MIFFTVILYNFNKDKRLQYKYQIWIVQILTMFYRTVLQITDPVDSFTFPCNNEHPGNKYNQPGINVFKFPFII